jgi:6-phosphogluconolactonase
MSRDSWMVPRVAPAAHGGVPAGAGLLRMMRMTPLPNLTTAGVLCLAAGLAVTNLPARAQVDAGRELLVYIGTYTGEKSRGIHVSRLNLSSGELTPPEVAAETQNPSFLAVHPTGNYLYAVNEVSTFDGQPGGSVSGFAVDRRTGRLTLLNQRSSRGSGPAHLVVDRQGRNVLVANYGGGSVAVLPIGSDGRLAPASAFVQHEGSSVHPKRQTRPYAHSINVDPDNRFAYAADLGLDKILIYRFDPAAGSLAPADPPFAAVRPGSGPRHLAFHPTGRFAYVINELLLTVTAFGRDAAAGALKEIETVSTLPPGQQPQDGYSTAEVQVHPSGRFLYGSNRGHDSITVFAVDEKSGRLTFVQNEPTQGSTPRGFGIDPTGQFLLAGNQRSDTIVVFRIDPQTGRLSAVGRPIQVGSPVSVQFVEPARGSAPDPGSSLAGPRGPAPLLAGAPCAPPSCGRAHAYEVRVTSRITVR